MRFAVAPDARTARMAGRDTAAQTVCTALTRVGSGPIASESGTPMPPARSSPAKSAAGLRVAPLTAVGGGSARRTTGPSMGSARAPELRRERVDSRGGGADDAPSLEGSLLSSDPTRPRGCALLPLEEKRVGRDGRNPARLRGDPRQACA